MIFYVLSKNKIQRVFVFIASLFFYGLKKAFDNYYLYRFFSEKKYKNFYRHYNKIKTNKFSKTKSYNELYVDYINAVCFDTFENAARLRLDIQREAKLNKKFKLISSNFLDVQFNKKKVLNQKKDRKFKNFLKNKTLIFFGPATGKSFYLGNDKIIVSPNISNEVLNLENCKKISYFNNRRVNYFTSETITKINQCDYSVVKSESAYNKLNLKNNHLRHLDEKNLFLFGSPMMLQVILLDLINHRPKKIILKNIDLFTKKKLYRSNYRTEKHVLDIKKRTNISLRIHDAFSNYFFLKNLYFNFEKIISIDPYLKEILSLNLLEYGKLIDQNLDKSISLKNEIPTIIRKKNESYN
tara:strand:- start:156 stop:1217 length:1062 start_codon:yes stop_codon:yes gene_type:complete